MASYVFCGEPRPVVNRLIGPFLEMLMSLFRFDMLILGVIAAGVGIAAIYLFMLAIPRNDDEHLHDGIGEPGHMKTRVLRRLAQLRRTFSR